MTTVTYEIRYYNTEALRQYERDNKEALDRDDWHYGGSYNDPKFTAEKVAALKIDYPHDSWCIIKRDPSAGDKNWRTREMTRLLDGTYKLVPGILPIDRPEGLDRLSDNDYSRHYGGRTFHDLLMQAAPHHFVHLSQSDERKLAFTESDLKGEKDKQRTISPMSYITRHIPHAWPDQIQDLFIEAMGGLDIQLQFAKTREEFVEIYTECDSSREVGSCMSHPTKNYESDPVHPVEVYAAGDLQLCYIRENGDTGKIWGRCLVWPEQKTWGRIYSTNASLMRKALRAAGYESGECTDSLIGAKLNLIWDDEDSNRIVMPYIDYTFRAQYDHDSGLLTIAGRDGNIEAETTNGLAYLDSANRYSCDRCGDSVHEDDSFYLESRDETWCRYCYENFAFHCDGCREDYDMNRTSYSVDNDGYTYCTDCYSERYHDCEDCHSETAAEEISYHEASGRHLCSDCYSERDAEEAEETEREAIADTAESIAQTIEAHTTRPYFHNCSIDNPSIAEGFPPLPYTHCYWRPRHAGDAPPYWQQGAFNTRLVRQDEQNMGRLTIGSWDYTTIVDYYLYAVPTYCVTGIYAEYRPEIEQTAQEELAAA